MSFDPLARHYSWMEWILAGQRLQSCRTAFLNEAASCQSALLVGEGHGRFLAELRRAAPAASICCVEQSAEMIRVTKRRLKRSGLAEEKTGFINVSIQEFEANRPFDLVATHFFLDCLDRSQLEIVTQKLVAALKPAGQWIISDFQVPEKGWRAFRARCVLSLAYGFFRVATKLPARKLVPPQPFLLQKGLRLKMRRQFNFDLLYAELWKKPAQ
ncbi:MAG TPA: class I SAM-dependent methyltransferase [Verrucomicrobiae bacterium]|jgi:ubiquinone/menaquinone biosynthesis C-methylase UbiE|nr:class I SAM-dependent methyltransferase [Verrucomicrobiae bacterium]